VSLARQAGDGRTEADALNSLASVALLVRGEQQTGLSLFQEALVLYRWLGDRVGECTGLNNLGYALLG
jgi:hypothetical protein